MDSHAPSPLPREARPYQGLPAGLVTRMAAAVIDAVVVGAVREPGLGAAVPQLALAPGVLDHLGVPGQRHPRAAGPDGDVDLRMGADVLDLARAALREEPQVAVELDLLQGHRAAHERAVRRGRGEHCGALGVDELRALEPAA